MCFGHRAVKTSHDEQKSSDYLRFSNSILEFILFVDLATLFIDLFIHLFYSSRLRQSREMWSRLGPSRCRISL